MDNKRLYHKGCAWFLSFIIYFKAALDEELDNPGRFHAVARAFLMHLKTTMMWIVCLKNYFIFYFSFHRKQTKLIKQIKDSPRNHNNWPTWLKHLLRTEVKYICLRKPNNSKQIAEISFLRAHVIYKEMRATKTDLEPDIKLCEVQW